MTSPAPRYFHHLNYTLGNEDTAVEHAVLPERASHVLCVAGSGARVLPLLARRPARITCVDVSAEQLQLTEMRVESARALAHADYLAFWGYPPAPASPAQRRSLFARIPMSSETAATWRRVFDTKEWESLLYDGRWERTFGKLAKVNRALTRDAGRRLFEASTHDDHRRRMASGFPRRRWLLTLLLLGNPLVFNLLLYKGGFPRKNIPGTPFGFYRDSFDRLFAQGPARDNFFLQLVFFGRLLFPEGNPLECRPDVYEAIRAGLADAHIDYRAGDVLDVARAVPEPIDFVSLSDVPSYFAPPQEQEFLQTLRPSLCPGARVVVRTYLRVPEHVDSTGFEDVTSQYAAVIAGEKVGVYQIQVLEKR